MTNINELVENYFTPESKTLTKQMLYEMFDELYEEVEIDSLDPFMLDVTLTGEEIGNIILSRIKEVSDLPENAVYKGGRHTIVLDNFGPLVDRDKVLKDLVNNNIVSTTHPYRAGMSRSGLTKYYFFTRGGNKKFITILLKQGKGTIASQGCIFEETVAHAINSFLVNHNIEEKFTAEVEGRCGVGSDVVIVDPHTNKKLMSFEVKTSKGSRIDFGQFRVKHDTIWDQATGLKNEVVHEIFDSIKETLNREIKPRKGFTFPLGPSLTPKEAEQFWVAYNPDWGKSLSSDVKKIKIDSKLIQQYYSQKGDDFIILGNDVFSLNAQQNLIELKDALEEVVALLRIKYHGPNYSYTIALRGTFKDEISTDFDTAMQTIFL